MQQPVPCFSCNEQYTENELPEMSGQYICPSCGQGWVMLEQRTEYNEKEQSLREDTKFAQRRWEIILEEDPDDPETLILPFPDDLLEITGWQIGDTLIWTIEDNGRVFITKK